MKRMAENPVTNELREFMKDHTGRHVWAHKVDVGKLRNHVEIHESSKFNSALHPIPAEEAITIIEKKMAEAVEVGKTHNDEEDKLTELKTDMDLLEKQIAHAHAQKRNYYNIPGSVTDDLKLVNKEFKAKQTNARHLREDLEKSNRRLLKDFRMPRHVPAADEQKAS